MNRSFSAAFANMPEFSRQNMNLDKPRYGDKNTSPDSIERTRRKGGSA